MREGEIMTITDIAGVYVSTVIARKPENEEVTDADIIKMCGPTLLRAILGLNVGGDQRSKTTLKINSCEILNQTARVLLIFAQRRGIDRFKLNGLGPRPLQIQQISSKFYRKVREQREAGQRKDLLGAMQEALLECWNENVPEAKQATSLDEIVVYKK